MLWILQIIFFNTIELLLEMEMFGSLENSSMQPPVES